MNPMPESSVSTQELRQRAEALARERGDGPPEESGRTLHELRVHQIELEMQNDELRRTQQELDASRARYFDLYDLAPVGYCTLTADGRIQEANLAAAQMLGATRAWMVRQPITRFILKEDQDLYYLHRRQHPKAEAPPGCELRMVKKDGAQVWVSLASSETLPAAGDPPGEGGAMSRLVLSDISERKRLEEAQAELETRLRQARKLETLGVLAGGVAHDLNNLLTTILANADMGSQAEPGKATARYFLAIEKAALKGTDLSRQLLAYAGKGKWVLTDVDLAIVVKEITEILAVSLPRNLTLTCDLADRIPFVKGDATQIFQVLMNLILNAFEAFSEGAAGEITLRTRAEGIQESILPPGNWVLPVGPGRYATVEVEDTGSGMSPETLARAFDPFFTTKSMGRGLGLAAAMGILNAHGGGITVASRPGGGSIFKVYLPALREERILTPPEAPPVSLGTGMLLVVDPDDGVRSEVRRMAQDMGFFVLEARNVQEGMETFRLRHGELTLVLLDLHLGGTTARDTSHRMERIDGRVPVLLCEHHDREDPPSPVPIPGQTLKKPFRLAEFQGVLRRALAQRDGAPA